MLELTISRAGEADATELLALQREAYQSEAEIYQDWSIAPLTETEGQFLQALRGQAILAARQDGRIVGSVRVELHETTCRIGRLFVSPHIQGKGLGRQLLQAAEGIYPAANCFQLFTGSKSVRNIALYQRLGYGLIGERRLNDKVTLAVLEKQNR